MKHYDFEKAVILDICERDGVKVTRATEGEAKFLLDGKPFDPVELIENLFKGDKCDCPPDYNSGFCSEGTDCNACWDEWRKKEYLKKA